MKTWFAAKLLFESRIDGALLEQPLCEESIRVLLCDTEAAARARAEEVGHGAEHEYVNEAGETVRWRFVSVLEVQDLGELALEDGTEVFSTLFRRENDGAPESLPEARTRGSRS
jgi:hypothetical protein